MSFSVSILMAISQGGTGLAGNKMSPFFILLEIRMMEVVVTNKTCKTQLNRHKSTPNFFCRPVLFCVS